MAVFRIRLLNGLQYRTAALAGVVTQFFWGFMLIMIYEAFYKTSPQAQPMPFGQLVSYLWLHQAFLVFIVLWYRDTEIFSLITTGNIAYELCRPSSLYGFWYAKLLAQRLAGAAMRCFPILIIAFILPEPYKMAFPQDAAAFGLFILTLCLGLLVLVSISMLVYISIFVTMSPTGSLLIFGVLGDFLAGGIIPVPLMPEWLQRITYLLPFRLASDLPFRIYSGNIPAGEALIWVGVQAAYLAVLVFAGRTAMQKVLCRVVVQGG